MGPRLLATLVRQLGDLDLAEEVASDAVASVLRRDRAYDARLALLQVEADRAEPAR